MPSSLRGDAPLERLDVSAYTIPTDAPEESDGTFRWRSTTLVLVEARAAGETGIGYTYSAPSAGELVRDGLSDVARGMDVMNGAAIWQALVRRVRNLGATGIASMAIAAVDAALWDLKARLLDLPLVTLLGAARAAMPIYGSGGFTSYTVEELREQLAGWVAEGIPRVKMKIGRDAAADRDRVRAARDAIGDEAELFVDANGAYIVTQALAQAQCFRDYAVSWFEEPVPYRDLVGTRRCRDRVPAGMDVAIGEYGFSPFDLAQVLEAGAVDVLQVDATRCQGITGLLMVDALCDAHDVPLSTHCAPALHLHAACAAKRLRHAEYFHDHVRIEHMLFDGVPSPSDGALVPDLTRPGMGLEFKHADARRFMV